MTGKDLKELIEDYEDEFYSSKGVENPNRERVRRERDLKAQLYVCSKDVRSMCRKMLKGKDRDRIADILGIKRKTLDAKVCNGRFSASELVLLADICGYRMEPVAKELLKML